MSLALQAMYRPFVFVVLAYSVDACLCDVRNLPLTFGVQQALYMTTA